MNTDKRTFPNRNNSLMPISKKTDSKKLLLALRRELSAALDIQQRRGKPLRLLLADAIERDPAGTISKVSRILPQDINISADESFTEALGEVSRRMKVIQNKTIEHNEATHLSGAAVDLKSLQNLSLSMPVKEETRSLLPDDIPFLQEDDINPFHVDDRDQAKPRRGRPRKSPLNDMPSDE